MSDILNTGKKRIDEITKKKEEREINDLKKLLSQVEFRRFIWRLLASTGMYRESFTGNSQTFYNNGQQAIGRKVTSWLLSANHNAFLQMQQEHYSEIISEEMMRQNERKQND